MMEILQPILYETVIKNYHVRSMANQSTSQRSQNCTVITYVSVLVTSMRMDGQIAKAFVDFQLETLIPVGMELETQGSSFLAFHVDLIMDYTQKH